jgi:folate-binding protein YgfZ
MTDLLENALGEGHAPRGAMVVQLVGAEVALHYGDPAAEYAAVRTAVGVADRTDRARIRMWGKDPARMLHGLITNELLQAAPGVGVYAGMLTPKGRMIADLRAFRTSGGDLVLELSREALAGTADHLRRFVPPMFARWEDASAGIRQMGAYGPRARALVAEALGTEIPELAEDAFVEVEHGGATILVVGSREIGGEAGYDLFVPSSAAAAVWQALADGSEAAGGRVVGFQALETLRMEAGRPRYGHELSEEVIPTEAFQESGLMSRAVSFQKGCYTGQEVIVRIAHRGHVNRHLRGFLLAGMPPPEAGTRLFHEESGKEVGRITGSTPSFRFGQTIALGYLRREVEPGGSVRVGSPDGPSARVARLPFDAD